jgi:ketosteroid isomerase-like protein
MIWEVPLRKIIFMLLPLLMISCGPQGSVDLEAERERVLEADRQFAIDTAERGADGWADFFAEDAIMFPANGKVEGRESIREFMAGVFGPDRPMLVWEPEGVVVGSGGDLAYTIGHWETVGEAQGERTVFASGNYLTVWRKTPGGEWKVATDMGNQDPPPAPPPASP